MGSLVMASHTHTHAHFAQEARRWRSNFLRKKRRRKTKDVKQDTQLSAWHPNLFFWRGANKKISAFSRLFSVRNVASNPRTYPEVGRNIFLRRTVQCKIISLCGMAKFPSKLAHSFAFSSTLWEFFFPLARLRNFTTQITLQIPPPPLPSPLQVDREIFLFLLLLLPNHSST